MAWLVLSSSLSWSCSKYLLVALKRLPEEYFLSLLDSLIPRSKEKRKLHSGIRERRRPNALLLPLFPFLPRLSCCCYSQEMHTLLRVLVVSLVLSFLYYCFVLRSRITSCITIRLIPLLPQLVSLVSKSCRKTSGGGCRLRRKRKRNARKATRKTKNLKKHGLCCPHERSWFSSLWFSCVISIPSCMWSLL